MPTEVHMQLQTNWKQATGPVTNQLEFRQLDQLQTNWNSGNWTSNNPTGIYIGNWTSYKPTGIQATGAKTQLDLLASTGTTGMFATGISFWETIDNALFSSPPILRISQEMFMSIICFCMHNQFNSVTDAPTIFLLNIRNNASKFALSLSSFSLFKVLHTQSYTHAEPGCQIFRSSSCFLFFLFPNQYITEYLTKKESWCQKVSPFRQIKMSIIFQLFNTYHRHSLSTKLERKLTKKRPRTSPDPPAPLDLHP